MKTYPIFRLTVFMAAGILFANTFWAGIGVIQLVCLLVLLLVMGLLLKTPSYSARWLFGVGVSCFMFLVGAIGTGLAWQKVKVDWNSERDVYVGIIQEPLLEKLKTYQCRVATNGKEVLIYLPKDSLSSSLVVGDQLLFYTRVDAPRYKDGFQTFDYATYLYHDGISGTAYVAADAWKKISRIKVNSWKLQALQIRQRILRKYEEWGIEDARLPVLSALTLGYQGDLDKETRKAYSVAGIAHVLALSGMHIGIIWFLLNGLFRWLLRNRLKYLKGIAIVAILWTFAFIVGLEASVVRAVIMCMLMEISHLAGVRHLSMNTLSVAAFFMLLYNPFYLFDVGFQLSFVAVASILYFYPLINGCLPVRNRIGKWTWGVMSVSMAAQLGTAPLVMYYFSNFSVYFLFTNLIASIIVPFIIYGTVGMMLLSGMPDLHGYMVKVVNGLVGILNEVAGWASGLPYATFSFSILTPIEIGMFYVMSGLWVMYGKTKRRKWLIGGLVSLACLLGIHLFLLFSFR